MENTECEETPNRDIEIFLKNLSESVKNDKLSAKQLQLVGEFYLSYSFQSDIEIERENDKESDCVDNDELIKFLSLGWYMYTFLIKKESRVVKQ